MGEAEPSLEDLMRRYQAGESDALEGLYQRVTPRLRAVFRQSTNESELDELIQETWFQVHRSRHTWRPTKLLLPWVYSIARHVRANYFRKTARRGEVELDERLSVPATELSFDWEQLLNELPPSQKEVLILMKVEGRTLEEVAIATGSTVGSVKQKAHRAYTRLRSLLGGEA